LAQKIIFVMLRGCGMAHPGRRDAVHAARRCRPSSRRRFPRPGKLR